MSPSGPMSYLFGGSWIVRGPVIEGAIRGEVGAAGCSADGCSPAGGGPTGSSAREAPARPSNAQAQAALEMMLFFMSFILRRPLEWSFRAVDARGPTPVHAGIKQAPYHRPMRLWRTGWLCGVPQVLLIFPDQRRCQPGFRRGRHLLFLRQFE